MPTKTIAKKKILVVDDDPSLVMLTKSRLKAHQYEVCSATNGDEAVKAAVLEKPDLILMDIIMPVMNGYEAVKVLKGATETQHIPIIVITGSLQTRFAGKCLQAGAAGIVVKPFKPEQLLAAVHDGLSGKNKKKKY